MVDFTFSSAMHFVTLISPYLLAFFFLMVSIFNQNIKGFVYIGGALIGSFIWMMFKGSSYGKGDVSELPAICSVIPNISNFPSYNSYFIAFTATYVLLPMLISSQLNWGLVAFFVTLFLLDGYFHNIYGCSKNSWSPIVGALIGILWAAGWFELFYQSGAKSLLYFDELTSNKAVCTRPTTQNFKCHVYKNGVIVKSL